MEERIQNIENDIKVIKNDLNENTNKLKKISIKLESSEELINIKLDNLLDNLKENYISYKGLFGMLAGFTAVIAFFIAIIF
ncbi:hypothetical protein [Commensalibacter sp. W8163]|uniref:hypothetical protein n=1 Tax=Commensalibacter sp. W8163 TaxID=2751023 RepID=UPI001E4CDA26|nr:hypothetical protein [Commensalibacter sp. W8163]